MLLLVGLQDMFYCSKMHWFFEVPLHFVTISRLLHYKTTYLFFRLGLFVNMLWKFFHPFWEGVFWTKVEAFVSWGCPPFYSNYMSGTSWWAFPLKGAQQPRWKGDKCVWLWTRGIHFSYEVPNARVPFALYFPYAWFFF